MSELEHGLAGMTKEERKAALRSRMERLQDKLFEGLSKEDRKELVSALLTRLQEKL